MRDTLAVLGGCFAGLFSVVLLLVVTVGVFLGCVWLFQLGWNVLVFGWIGLGNPLTFLQALVLWIVIALVIAFIRD